MRELYFLTLRILSLLLLPLVRVLAFSLRSLRDARTWLNQVPRRHRVRTLRIKRYGELVDAIKSGKTGIPSQRLSEVTKNGKEVFWA